MKKKIVALCLVLALAITAIGGATLAYFTDTEKATNTMVFGNIDIDIDELTYTDGEWAKFEDDKFVLYPQKYEDGTMNFNKMVQTWNNSKNDQAAYIRNIILIEVPNGTAENDHIQFIFANNDSGKQHGAVKVGAVEGTDLVIDNVHYWAYAYTDKDYEAIPSGEYLSTLSSVWLKDYATQDQIKAYGDKVDIITFSQAIQAEDLTYEEAMAALGELNAANIVSWVTAADEATINDHYSF